MTPTSKGTSAKKAPAPRSGSASNNRAGGKNSKSKAAAATPKRPSLNKKASAVVNKATTASKKAASAAKKSSTPPKGPAANAKSGAGASKETGAAGAVKRTATAAKTAATAKRPVPVAKKAAPAPKAPSSKTAPEVAKKTASSASVSDNGSGAAPSRQPSVLRPKEAPVRPKTGPYAKDPKFLEEVRDLLLADRGVYQEQATSLREEADSLALEREPGDVQFDEESGEGGTVTVDRERNLALSGQATIAVEEIDAALARIEDKTYGYCERCFQPIPKPRLRALPYARLCVACKSGGLSRR